MRALLAVSASIALFNSEHVHHDLAAQGLLNHGQKGWATCPLTQTAESASFPASSRMSIKLRFP